MTGRQISAYLLDRADQYEIESPCWIALTDAAKNIMNGEVQRSIDHGELEDRDLMHRVDSMKRTSVKAVDPHLGVNDDD